MTVPQFVLALLMSVLAMTARAEDLTFDVSYYYYEEPNFMNDESDPAFLSLGLKRWDTSPRSWHFLYTTEITRGFVRYNGSGNLNKDYYKIRAEAYGSFGYMDFAPIFGVGYRWLYDDSGGTTSSTGALGYDRESQYLYIPLGLTYRFNQSLRIKGQYNLFVYGRQTSYLSDIAGFSNVENDQHDGWGVDFTADYKISARFGLYAFFRYWDIEDSDLAFGTYNGALAFSAYEPANTTVEAGIGVSYKF